MGVETAMTMNDRDISKEYGKKLGLTNFTSTEMRRSKLDGADLKGAYFIKASTPSAAKTVLGCVV